MRLNSLERDNTRVRGEQDQLTSAISQAKGKIAEINLQILQIDKEFKADVLKELREIEIKIGQTVEKRVAAQDQLTRVNIQSPIDGIVDQLSVHTIGGVIQSGEIIMNIVPKDSLVVEAKIDPKDISKLKYEQTASLRFTSFDSKLTPEIDGKVSFISANIETDLKYDRNYYIARISVHPDQQRKLGNVKLVPGMPVETFIKTEDRKVITYLIKPLSDQIHHAFREP
jgi:HlyD family secretion protein